MPLRTSLLTTLLCTALASSAAADRVIVAAEDGFLYQADTATGAFEPFSGPCIAPFERLATDDQHLFGEDGFGTITVIDRVSGAMLAWLTPGVGTITSLAAGREGLFVGTAEGAVVHLDPLSGAALETRQSPGPADALLVHGGFVYVGTSGAIYRAPAEGGAFEYFTCFCFFGLKMLVVDGGELVAVDQSGIVARIELATGTPTAAFSMGGPVVSGVSDGVLLLYYDGGVIPLASAHTGELLGTTLQAPARFRSLVVIDTPERRAARPKGTPRPR
jgi:outer membrane protein assembly factor BamB